MKTTSLKEAFSIIRKGNPIVILYILKNMSINSTLEQVSSQINESNNIVDIIKVEVDPDPLSKEDARKLGLIRLPQLHFYNSSVLLATMSGQVAPSDIYEKILSLYS